MAGIPSTSEFTSREKLSAARSPEPGSFRELMSVAVPLVLSCGSLSLVIAIDRLFLTWYSTEALAASTPASGLYWAALSALIGTVNYVNTFVAQYDGSGQADRIAASVWQGIWLAIAGGALFVGLVPLSPWIFAWVGHEPEVQRLEVQFFSVLSFGALPMLLSMALACFFSGRGKTRVVMYANFVLAATNIGLDPLLIFGVWPFPRLGIAGAALATDLSYIVLVGLYGVLSIRHADFKAHQFWKHTRCDRKLMGRLFFHGFPTGLQMAAECSAFSIFLFLVGRLGTQDLAATNLAFNVNALSFVPMIGVGVAVMTLVGRRIGEGRPELAVRTTWLAAAASGAYMLLFGLFFIASPETILRPFTRPGADGELAGIRDQVIVLLRFVAFYTFFDGISLVFAFAIRGAGDTRFPFIYTLVIAWSVMVLPTYAFVTTGRGGLLACWSACSAYVTLLGTGFLIRFLQGKWKTMSVIDRA